MLQELEETEGNYENIRFLTILSFKWKVVFDVYFVYFINIIKWHVTW